MPVQRQLFMEMFSEVANPGFPFKKSLFSQIPTFPWKCGFVFYSYGLWKSQNSSFCHYSTGILALYCDWCLQFLSWNVQPLLWTASNTAWWGPWHYLQVREVCFKSQNQVLWPCSRKGNRGVLGILGNIHQPAISYLEIVGEYSAQTLPLVLQT